MRRLLALAAALGAALLVAAALLLAEAHLEIRSLDGPLPDADAVFAAGAGVPPPALPVRVSRLETARQRTPRAAVLDPARDPQPAAPYELGHSAFALSWADGRVLLVDAGMERDAARSFGRPLEWFAGADPMRPETPVAEQLGAAAARVDAVVLTHLHSDHTQGLAALCAVRPAEAPALPVWQTPQQAERGNYTTWPGRSALAEARCAEPRRLAEAPLAPVPGHPGVFVLSAAGHTPGSQVVVAFLGAGDAVTPLVFVGDVANAVDGIRHEVPKPAAYRMLAVPESDARLARLRALLRTLEARGATLLPAHDALHLDTAGIPAW